MLFANAFGHYLNNIAGQLPHHDVNQLCLHISGAFEAASETIQEERQSDKKRPWISARTLHLLDLRVVARTTNNFEEEIRLHKLVRQSAKKDRNNWLTELAGSGSWGALRRLRKEITHNQGRLKDAKGDFVSSEDRAQTFADYLESVQWRVRPANVTEEPIYPDELPVALGPVTQKELQTAVKALRKNKAAGPDGHPLEFWSAVLDNANNASQDGSRWLVELC